MNKLLPILILVLTLTCFGQTPVPSTDYWTTAADDPYVQVLPSDTKIIAEADAGNAFQSLGIIATPSIGNYGLMFVNVQEDYQFENQRSQLFNLYADGVKLGSYMPTIVKKFAGKKYRAEYLTVPIGFKEIERILDADDIAIAYGRISYRITPGNLTAIRSIKDRYNSRAASRRPNPANLVEANADPVYGDDSSTYNGPVRVRGYRRSDGTYVRPHTRRLPRRSRY